MRIGGIADMVDASNAEKDESVLPSMGRANPSSSQELDDTNNISNRGTWVTWAGLLGIGRVGHYNSNIDLNANFPPVKWKAAIVVHGQMQFVVVPNCVSYGPNTCLHSALLQQLLHSFTRYSTTSPNF